MATHNPHEDPKRKGYPKKGEAVPFFAWEREQKLKEISKLPEEEQKVILEADKKFADRIAS